jgi:hypothetical protein
MLCMHTHAQILLAHLKLPDTSSYVQMHRQQGPVLTSHSGLTRPVSGCVDLGQPPRAPGRECRRRSGTTGRLPESCQRVHVQICTRGNGASLCEVKWRPDSSQDAAESPDEQARLRCNIKARSDLRSGAGVVEAARWLLRSANALVRYASPQALRSAYTGQ